MAEPADYKRPRHMPIVAYDCWGILRYISTGRRNGVPYLACPTIDEPREEPHASRPDRRETRRQLLIVLETSTRLTRCELRTLYALVVERQTFADIAFADGCTRQAVIARLIGNSLGQGGVLKKVRALARDGIWPPNIAVEV